MKTQRYNYLRFTIYDLRSTVCNLLFLCSLLFPFVSLSAQTLMPDSLLYVYSLHGQTRKFECAFQPSAGGVKMDMRILRNGKWLSGSFIMSEKALQSASNLSYQQPAEKDITLSDDETFGIVSQKALETLKSDKSVSLGKITYQYIDANDKAMGKDLIHARDSYEGGEIWVLDCPALPVIWKMTGNPVGINWSVEPYSLLTREAYTLNLNLREEIMKSPEKMGSIYYAYPTPSAERTAVPEGYEPVYISHYGRHGSRWMTNDQRYRAVIDVFDSLAVNNLLTDLGKDVHARLQEVWEDAQGRGGQLSAVGEAQHHTIGLRMIESFPTVFEGEANITAVASTSQRCIMSMAAFCEALKEQNPSLKISRHTGDRYMRYIAWSSDESKLHDSPNAPWYNDYLAFCEENIKPEHFVSQLVVNPSSVEKPSDLMMGMYWIASDMQDTPIDVSFYDLFTPEELFGIWQTVNFRMYICNAESPVGNYSGPRSAKSLLDDVINKAETALAGGDVKADLRFGHDTNLIRLLTRMSIVSCNNKETDPSRYYQAWQDFRVSPMAANLQIIFYRNSAGNVLVKLLHNEEEARLPISSATAPYYDWEEVKKLWSKEY